MEPTETNEEKLAKLLTERQMHSMICENHSGRVKSLKENLKLAEEDLSNAKAKIAGLDADIFATYTAKLNEVDNGTA